MGYRVVTSGAFTGGQGVFDKYLSSPYLKNFQPVDKNYKYMRYTNHMSLNKVQVYLFPDTGICLVHFHVGCQVQPEGVHLDPAQNLIGAGVYLGRKVGKRSMHIREDYLFQIR